MNKNCFLVWLSLTVALSLFGMVIWKALIISLFAVETLKTIISMVLVYMSEPVPCNNLMSHSVKVTGLTVLIVLVIWKI